MSELTEEDFKSLEKVIKWYSDNYITHNEDDWEIKLKINEILSKYEFLIFQKWWDYEEEYDD